MKVIAVLEENEGSKLKPCVEKGSLVQALREDYFENSKKMSFKEKIKARTSLLATEQVLARMGLDKYSAERKINADEMTLDLDISLISKMRGIKQGNVGEVVGTLANGALVVKTKKELDALGVKYKSVYFVSEDP